MMVKKSKRISILALTLALVFLMGFGGTGFAFSDIQGDPGEASILALKEKGIVGGMGDDTFVPKGKMSYAQAVHLVVKGFGLNIDNIRFIKEPKAKDYFTEVPDDAWYAPSYIIAQLNGLPVPKDVNPNRTISREEFTGLLYSGLLRTGDYAFVEMFIIIQDADQIAPACMDGIQKLLIAKIATLDEKGEFHPKAEITRSEAAVMLDRALAFVEQHHKGGSGKPGTPDDPASNEQVTVTVNKLTDEVSKVTILWGEKPNPGYRVVIQSVDFPADGTALVKYQLLTPDPEKSYPAVITEAKADAYVPANMKTATEQVR